MYKAYLKETDDSRDKKTIHEPLNYGNKLSSGELKVSLEGLGISTFECSLSIANNLYGKTKLITNMICVLDANGEKVFHGRIAKITKSMTSSGEFSEKILHMTERRALVELDADSAVEQFAREAAAIRIVHPL